MHKLTVAVPDADSLRSTLHAVLANSCEARFAQRLHCVLLVAEGLHCSQVARCFGKDERTIGRWVRALTRYGVDGLRERHRGGHPARLSTEQRLRLARDLQQPPQAFGYTIPAWSGKLLARHLWCTYAVTLSARQCQRILERLTHEGRLPGRGRSESEPPVPRCPW